MLGVILWSDATDLSAVIWCEDQGELAYLAGGSAEDQGLFSAGDLVEFDFDADCKVRTAKNVRLLAEQVCPEIVRELDIMAALNQKKMREQAAAPVVDVDDSRDERRVVAFRRPAEVGGTRGRVAGFRN